MRCMYAYLDKIFYLNALQIKQHTNIKYLRMISFISPTFLKHPPFFLPVQLNCASEIRCVRLRKNDKALIYNYVSSKDVPLTWYEYKINMQTYIKKCRMNTLIFLPILIKTKFLYGICFCIFYTLPAIVLDAVNKWSNKQSFRKLYSKLHELTKVIGYFTMQKWTFANDNVEEMWCRLDKEDQRLFNFSMKEFNWSKYLDNHFKGIFTYILKQDPNVLEVNCKKLERCRQRNIRIWIIISLTVLASFVILLFRATF